MLNKKNLCLICLLVCFCCAPSMVGAQTSQNAGLQMEEVVVSASRTETRLQDAPQNITVLDSEEIMDSPYERVKDIVRSVPGLHNFRHNSLQTNGIVRRVLHALNTAGRWSCTPSASP